MAVHMRYKSSTLLCRPLQNKNVNINQVLRILRNANDDGYFFVFPSGTELFHCIFSPNTFLEPLAY